MPIDQTHDPALRSWVESANAVAADFPIQNLPHAVFRRRGSGEAWRGGVAIGSQVLDMAAAVAAGVFPEDAGAAAEAAAADALNSLMAMGRPSWRALRAALSRVLADGAPQAARLAACLVPQAEVEFNLPARIGDYTDFFTSRDHMINMGRLFRPDDAELPQFKWLPIAYHGRASTVEPSGATFQRPWGQGRAPGANEPYYAPVKRLDYEVEVGAFIGPGNRRGEPIGIDEAEQHLFGVCLLNDWSARDVQGWESVPLGPFLAKNFLTTISPWVVTMEALAPFRCPVRRDADDPPLLPYLVPRAGNDLAGVDIAIEALIVTMEALAPFRCPVRRDADDPPLLPYLVPRANNDRAGIDIAIEALIVTPLSAGEAMRLSLSSTRHGCWSFAQMLVHHTENGCAMRSGDLIGSGTQSGPGPGERGCLMEITSAGRQPIVLANGEQRAMLEDGDTVILRAWAESPGATRIGFGECRATVLPARAGSRGQAPSDLLAVAS